MCDPLCPSEQEDIAKLLRFESSALPVGQQTNLMEYGSRMKAGTRNIYYLCAPNRHLAEHSPYYEAMKQKDMEVRGAQKSPPPIRGLQLEVLLLSSVGAVLLRAVRRADPAAPPGVRQKEDDLGGDGHRGGSLQGGEV